MAAGHHRAILTAEVWRMGKKFNHHFYRRWLFWFGIAFWVAEALSWSFDNWSVKLLGVAIGLFLIIWSMDGE